MPQKPTGSGCSASTAGTSSSERTTATAYPSSVRAAGAGNDAGRGGLGHRGRAGLDRAEPGRVEEMHDGPLGCMDTPGGRCRTQVKLRATADGVPNQPQWERDSLLRSSWCPWVTALTGSSKVVLTNLRRRYTSAIREGRSRGAFTWSNAMCSVDLLRFPRVAATSRIQRPAPACRSPHVDVTCVTLEVSIQPRGSARRALRRARGRHLPATGRHPYRALGRPV